MAVDREVALLFPRSDRALGHAGVASVSSLRIAMMEGARVICNIASGTISNKKEERIVEDLTEELEKARRILRIPVQ